MWPWQLAAITAAVLAGVGWVLRRGPGAAPRLAPYLTQAAVVLCLYAVWQIALDALVVHSAGAIRRATDIYHWERDLHLPSEVSIQRAALHHPTVVRWANRYYADADFPALCLCLLWLFARHRDRYPSVRRTLVVSTAICTFIQAIPVAPPRFVPQLGFIDMGLRFGQSVYGPSRTDPSVLTTMPSVHVAWAALVAVAVCASSTSRWRWAFVAHPVLTVYVVVVTGNHFWADCIVALAILTATLLGQWAWRRGGSDHHPAEATRGADQTLARWPRHVSGPTRQRWRRPNAAGLRRHVLAAATRVAWSRNASRSSGGSTTAQGTETPAR